MNHAALSIPLCPLPSRGLGTRVNGGQESDTCHAHGRLQPEREKKALSKEGKWRCIDKQAREETGQKGSRLQPEGGGDSMPLGECAREDRHADAGYGARGVEECERLASQLGRCRLAEGG